MNWNQCPNRRTLTNTGMGHKQKRSYIIVGVIWFQIHCTQQWIEDESAAQRQTHHASYAHTFYTQNIRRHAVERRRTRAKRPERSCCPPDRTCASDVTHTGSDINGCDTTFHMCTRVVIPCACACVCMHVCVWHEYATSVGFLHSHCCQCLRVCVCVRVLISVVSRDDGKICPATQTVEHHIIDRLAGRHEAVHSEHSEHSGTHKRTCDEMLHKWIDWKALLSFNLIYWGKLITCPHSQPLVGSHPDSSDRLCPTLEWMGVCLCVRICEWICDRIFKWACVHWNMTAPAWQFRGCFVKFNSELDYSITPTHFVNVFENNINQGKQCKIEAYGCLARVQKRLAWVQKPISN